MANLRRSIAVKRWNTRRQENISTMVVLLCLHGSNGARGLKSWSEIYTPPALLCCCPKTRTAAVLCAMDLYELLPPLPRWLRFRPLLLFHWLPDPFSFLTQCPPCCTPRFTIKVVEILTLALVPSRNCSVNNGCVNCLNNGEQRVHVRQSNLHGG